MTTQNQQVKKQDIHEAELVQKDEGRPIYTPATDIYVREDAIVVLADMPGVIEKNVEVNLDDNVLTLRGSTEPESNEGYEVLYRDYEPGVYERSFTLSAEIDREKINAQMKHGVLKVVLPKAAHAQPRKIQVQIES